MHVYKYNIIMVPHVYTTRIIYKINIRLLDIHTLDIEFYLFFSVILDNNSLGKNAFQKHTNVNF